MDPVTYESPLSITLPGGELVDVTRFDGASYVLADGRTFLLPASESAPGAAASLVEAHIADALNADPVPARRAELKKRLAYRRWQFEVSGGVTIASHPGFTFHSDDRSQFNVLGAVVQNFAGGWKTEQGVFVEMSAEDMNALAEACGVRKATAYGYEAYLIAQLDAAATPQEIETLSLTVETFAP